MKVSRRLVRAAALATFCTLPFAAMAQTADQLPNRLIVHWKPSVGALHRSPAAVQALEAAAARAGATVTPLRQIATGGELLSVEGAVSSAQLEQMAADLARDPNVKSAEVDRRLKALLTPNDTRYNEQWHYFEATGGLNAPTAWDVTNGTGVKVAVIDTGYRPHADLAANIVGGYDFISDTFTANDGGGRDSDASDPGDWFTSGQCGDPSSSNSSWHGTHVSGTIAAVTNNASGVAGVAYGAKVVPVRVLGRCGGSISDIADAIIWASGGTVTGVPANANPAKVISMSLGGGGACGTTMQSAINSARSRGTVVVVAAGNENQNASNSTPANCSGVIAVAATNRNGSKAFYSNFGTIVDVAAPGGDTSGGAANGILSTLNAGTTTPGADSYAFYQGTSMATPHVSAVVALMLAVNASLTPDDVETRLKGSTRAFPGTCSGCGTGIVHARAAVDAATGGGGGGGTVLQNGVPVNNLSGSTGTELRFTMDVPAGASNLVFQMSGGTGDADLYVRFGSAPTTATYDCRPFSSGNNENCSFPTPQVGTYHVMIRGFSAFSGVSLVGSYSTGACSAGFTHYTGSLTSGGQAFAPSSSGSAAAAGLHQGRLSGPGTADFDLYLHRWNGSSWTTVASGTGSTSTEAVDYNGTAGTYRWRVHAWSGSGTYNLCVKKP
jgi:serine protease